MMGVSPGRLRAWCLPAHLAAFLVGVVAWLFLPGAASAQLNLDVNATNSELEQALEGPGVSVGNGTLSPLRGISSQYGLFEGGDDITGAGPTVTIDRGVFLATAPGNASPVRSCVNYPSCTTTAGAALLGPNDSPSVSGLVSGAFSVDPQLATVDGGAGYDTVALELEVTPSGSYLKFSFVFASDEYPEFVCTIFNDAFGFFIRRKGTSTWQNVALLPGTSTPIAVNTINGGVCGADYNPGTAASSFTLSNSRLYVNNGDGSTPLNNSHLQYDGFSIPIVVDAAVTAGATYEVKLVIADSGDANWDSAIFLKWISSSNFANDADIEIDLAVDDNTPTAGDTVTFTLDITNTGQDAATGAQADFPLPAGFAWVSDTSGGNYNPSTGVWTVPGSLAGTGGSQSIDIVATAGGSGGIDAFAELSVLAANDVDSTPGNGAAPTPAEDDEAVATLDVSAVDLSDAPRSGTSYGEATHAIVSGLQLGAAIDADSVSIANADASGDGADDDGVTIPSFVQGASLTLPVSVTQASAGQGYLQGWVDWNGDGDFADAGEQVATNLQSATADTSTINVSVTVPASATTGQTFARFRWSTMIGLDTTTAAPDGEVEDYAVTIIEPGNLPDASVIDTCPMPSVYVANGGSATWPTRPGVTVTATSNMGSLNTNAPRELGNVDNEIRTGAEVIRWQKNGGNIDLTLNFSPALPANEIALLVYDLGLGSSSPYTAEFNFDVSGGATTQDFRAASVGDHPDTLLFNPATGQLFKSNPSHTVRESAVLVGQDTQLVSQITLRSNGIASADFIGVTLFAVTGCDFSDAPASFGEAGHIVVSDVVMGSLVDDENAARPTPDATGDDTDGMGDEDGVALPTLTQGQAATIPVTVNQTSGNSGYLQGWIDWNGDGDFADAGEQVASDLQSTGAGTTIINVPVTVPATAVTTQTFARFRWSTTSGLDATTAAPDGEVEDYAVTVAPGGIDVTGTVFFDTGAGPGATAHNGLIQGDEAGAPGVTVQLVNTSNGQVIDATETDGSGGYAFSVPSTLAGTEVTVRIVPPADARNISSAVANMTDGSTLDGEAGATLAIGTAYSADFGLAPASRLVEGQSVTVTPGGVSRIAHTFTAGTAMDVDFSIAGLETSSPSSFTTTLWRDDDCSGDVSGAEAVLSGTQSLAAGEIVCLVARVEASGGLASGATVSFDVMADAVLSGTAETEQLSNTDRVTVNDGASLTLTKQVCNASQSTCNAATGAGFGTNNRGAPGEQLVYRLVFENPTAEPLDDVRVYDRTPDYSATIAGGASMIVQPSSVACSLVQPASPVPAGFEGVVEWNCSGQMAPGDRGIASFTVEIAD